MKPEWSYARGVEEEPSEHSFYNIDTEQLYKKNLQENYDQLKENGWLSIEEDQIEKFCLDKEYHYYLYTPNKPVLNDWVKLSYQLNSHGFRCEEMPNEKKTKKHHNNRLLKYIWRWYASRSDLANSCRKYITP
ncbi:hypothetical protein OAA34_00485 [bacterium]|nr:hypothetical protein [bacterium]